MHIKIFFLLITSTLVFGETSQKSQDPNSQGTVIKLKDGQVLVEKVKAVGKDGTIYCDIKDWPEVVGKNMPVKISGVINNDNTTKALPSPEVISLLVELLQPEEQIQRKDPRARKTIKDKKQTVPVVILSNIRRGSTFCLIADIEVEGNDLGDILIQKGFAEKVIKIQTHALPNQSVQKNGDAVAHQKQLNQSVNPQPAAIGYVSSKTSKVFHKITCPHAKRIDETKMVKYSNRQEAINAGKRPCKTCNP